MKALTRFSIPFFPKNISEIELEFETQQNNNFLKNNLYFEKLGVHLDLEKFPACFVTLLSSVE